MTPDEGAMQPDKQILHSDIGSLSRETEKLYEDFDPMVEYSATGMQGYASFNAGSAGTALLYPTETESRYEGTMLLEDISGGITEDLMQCVKFSITRSYLVVHSEESILEK